MFLLFIGERMLKSHTSPQLSNCEIAVTNQLVLCSFAIIIKDLKQQLQLIMQTELSIVQQNILPVRIEIILAEENKNLNKYGSVQELRSTNLLGF